MNIQLTVTLTLHVFNLILDVGYAVLMDIVNCLNALKNGD